MSCVSEYGTNPLRPRTIQCALFSDKTTANNVVNVVWVRLRQPKIISAIKFVISCKYRTGKGKRKYMNGQQLAKIIIKADSQLEANQCGRLY